ncbi:hypothetical protein ACFL0F_00710 [Patescibacteria group bacterium]
MRKDEFDTRYKEAIQAGENKSQEIRVRTWGGMGLVLDDGALDLYIRGRWLNINIPPNNPDILYPGIALGKMVESAITKVATPTLDPKISKGAFGFKGGDRRGMVISGVSGTTAEKDFAIVCEMYDKFWEDQPRIVHHVGVRVATADEYRRVIRALDYIGISGVSANTTDHYRTYFKVGQPYLEIQYFPPDKSNGPSSHVDVVAFDNPVVVLASLVDSNWVDLGEKSEPRGLANITEAFSIMARTPSGGLWVPPFPK